jgi:hypothetical protein
MSYRVVTECDIHLLKHEKVTAPTSIIYRNGPDDQDEKILDLCDEHRLTLSVADLLLRGRPFVTGDLEHPPISLRGRAQVTCDYCGKPYGRGSGISLHMKSKHPQFYVPGPTNGDDGGGGGAPAKKHKKGK